MPDLVLTGLSPPGNLLRALQVHVRGFLIKDAPATALAQGIRRVGHLVDSASGGVDTEIEPPQSEGDQWVCPRTPRHPRADPLTDTDPTDGFPVAPVVSTTAGAVAWHKRHPGRSIPGWPRRRLGSGNLS